MLQKLKQRLKNQRGMTLVELLAVIVILGIISAIAVPSIGNVIKKSQDKATVAEGLQIIDAAKLYEANQSAVTAGSLTPAMLAPYLDHVKDSTFTVNVIVDANGKVSYTLAGHASVALADGTDTDTVASEQELTDYNGN
jgi:type IV pilus assembly protein PilA